MRPLKEESLLIAIPGANRLARAQTLAIKELSQEPVILFSRALHGDRCRR